MKPGNQTWSCGALGTLVENPFLWLDFTLWPPDGHNGSILTNAGGSYPMEASQGLNPDNAEYVQWITLHRCSCDTTVGELETGSKFGLAVMFDGKLD